MALNFHKRNVVTDTIPDGVGAVVAVNYYGLDIEFKLRGAQTALRFFLHGKFVWTKFMFQT
jgi:hypothetical protein